MHHSDDLTHLVTIRRGRVVDGLYAPMRRDRGWLVRDLAMTALWLAVAVLAAWLVGTAP